ncbi:PD40 domain-containing protein [bacterium]|nr:PD40 domain-containing protein [bacterium]
MKKGCLLLCALMILAISQYAQAEIKIAVTSNEGGNYNIFSYTLDESYNIVEKKQLTTVGSREDNPAWSPDGSKIAFCSNNTHGYELWIMNADGSDQVMVTMSQLNVLGPFVWSPDQNYIYGLNARSGDGEVAKIDVHTGVIEMLTNIPGQNTQSFSLNTEQSKVVFVRGSEGNGYSNKLYMADFQSIGPDFANVALIPQALPAPHVPDVSPDGNLILVQLDINYTSNTGIGLYHIQEDRFEEIIPPDGYMNSYPEWIDNDRFIYSHGQAYNENLYIYDLKDRSSTQITSTSRREIMAAVLVTAPQNEGPVADAGPDQTCEAALCEGAPVTLSACASSDADGDALTFTWVKDGAIVAGPTASCTIEMILPLGDHSIILKVDDGKGGTDEDEVLVTVQDTQAPSIAAELSVTELWPPNHKMVDITATVDVADLCQEYVSFVLDTIISNEPDDAKGLGDGETVDDIQNAEFGTPDTEFSLRAERDGKGTGRFYEVIYLALDGAGNTAVIADTVWVRESQKKLKKDIAGSGAAPETFALYPNYPNPFNPSTEIQFSLTETRHVILIIYNSKGQEVICLTDADYPAGRHAVTWNSTDALGRAVSSGLYFFKLNAGEFSDIGKMMLMR